MRALVTGGAGFIGSHIIDALLRQNVEVVVLDSLEERVHGPNATPRVPDEVRFVRGDVRDKNAWIAALEGVDLVFHEAAYQDYLPDYAKFFHVNVVGTALMYEVIRETRAKVRKIVVASSQAVYGEGQYDCPNHGFVLPRARSQSQMASGRWELCCSLCDQQLKPRLLDERYSNPYNQYALSKLSQEMAALRLGRNLDVPTVALRYSITQGPRQSPYNAYSGVCRIFTARLLNGEPPIIYEDGEQLRDYCHIDDVVAANLLVAADSRADYEPFNVGTGVGTSVREYATMLSEVTECHVDPLIPGRFRVGDNRHSVSSIGKLKSLGWAPRKDLRQIMTDYWTWCRESGPRGQFYLGADSDMERNGIVCAAGQMC
jgi:dTDP-L-rhamnose 4-epimerase